MKQTFVMYKEWDDMIATLNEYQKGELLSAIMDFQMGREISELSDCVKVAFAQIKMQFGKDEEKYSETVEKRKEASKRGVEVRKQKETRDIQTQPNGNQVKPSGNQTQPNGNQVVGDSVCDSVCDSDCDSDCDCVSDCEILKSEDLKKQKESRYKAARERFEPPSVEEVESYAAERGYAVDAERFVDFYQSKGWMIGKNKMKDWKAAVRNWSKSARQEGAAKPNSAYMDAIENRVKEVDGWI